MEFLKRTWSVIHLDRLDHNVKQIASRLPSGTRIMGVVKADGYGHGDKHIARELNSLGVDFLAVSNLEEALSLRRGGVDCDILILGFTPVSRVSDLYGSQITQAVFSLEYARQLNAECERQQVQVKTHIKIDTGMGRIGIVENGEHCAAEEVAEIYGLSNLECEGIFSHLSSADSLDEDSVAYTRMQVEGFHHTVAELEERGIHFACKHLQNSAGIAFLPEEHYDYVRAGIVLYGVAPSGEEVPFPLEPVMELKTVISLVKEIGPGMAVSYNRKFVSEHAMKIATVPIGYADGYPRLLSNRAEMLLKGKRVPVIGNICMDQLILDVTGIDDVKMGDVVTVVGTDGDETISFDELAEKIGTISYEMMCLIGRRVPRVYRKDGKTVAIVNYIQD